MDGALTEQAGQAAIFPDLRGRTALVTGAFSGLGQHIAQTLATAGVRVALAGRRLEQGAAVLAGIEAAGGAGAVVALDVQDAASIDAAFDAAAEALGPVGIVVNNAGIAVTAPAYDVTEADWSRVIDTNLTGAWRVAQAAGRRMRESGQGGSIINIASILGLRVTQQVPAYAAAKAGLVHLTRALALEWARDGIRVNAIAPGYIETGINREFFASEPGQALIRRVPQRRLGQAADLDGALLLLASDASAFMTGTVIPVDGGHSINSL